MSAAALGAKRAQAKSEITESLTYPDPRPLPFARACGARGACGGLQLRCRSLPPRGPVFGDGGRHFVLFASCVGRGGLHPASLRPLPAVPVFGDGGGTSFSSRLAWATAGRHSFAMSRRHASSPRPARAKRWLVEVNCMRKKAQLCSLAFPSQTILEASPTSAESSHVDLLASLNPWPGHVPQRAIEKSFTRI